MELFGETLGSRLFLGTGRYSSLDILSRTLRSTRPGLVTASIRQAGPSGVEAQGLADILLALDIPILPNTAGCATVRDAVTTAQIAREMFGTEWIKLEVIGSPRWLEPDVVGLIEAATILADEGFEVFPYTTEDLRVAERLLRAGCRVLMPWAAPIGSGRGLEAEAQLARLRAAFPDVPMIIDAGIVRPSQAAAALEMGFEAVLLNTAVAQAGDPPLMAQAFKAAIEAGRLAYEAGLMAPRNQAAASTPDEGKASFA
jgi:thiazole synthase